MSGLRRLSDTALSGAAAGASALLPLPTYSATLGRYAPGGGIGDNPVYATHNLQPSYLKYTTAALAAMRIGQRDFRMVITGDSITAGSSSTFASLPLYLAQNLGRKAAQYLGARFGVTARRSMIPVATNSTIDPQWTVGSGWTVAGLASPLGTAVSSYTAASANAGILDFTPTDDSGVALQTDSFIVYAFGGGAGNNFQWAIDGGSYTTQTVTAVNGTGFNSFTISAGTLGLHTLHIKSAVSGANATYILGVEAVNSTDKGIRYYISGTGGSVTPAGISSLELTFAKSIAPDLHVFEWNTNDYGSQVALATFQANVTTTAAQPATYTKPADVLWLASPPQGVSYTIPQSSYYATLDAVSDAAGFPVLHADRRFVSYAISNPSPISGYTDTIHPSFVGHNEIGAMLANLLSTL